MTSSALKNSFVSAEVSLCFPIPATLFHPNVAEDWTQGSLCKLEPISNAKGLVFIHAWIDCYRGKYSAYSPQKSLLIAVRVAHFQHWLHGRKQGGIGLQNFMYNPRTGRGTFYDPDIAVVRKPGGHECTATECTSTIPFIALDLLGKWYIDGRTARLYRHDLESCIWILLYVLFRGRSDAQDAMLNAWNTGDYDLCQAKKNAFLWDANWKPSCDYAEVWSEIGLDIILWFDWTRSDMQRFLFRRKGFMHGGSGHCTTRLSLAQWEDCTGKSAGAILADLEHTIAERLTHTALGLEFHPLSEAQLSL